MNQMQEIQGACDGTGRRFALVASRFNGRLVELMVDGALDCLREHGVAEGDLAVVRVPGAFEIPLALEALAAAGGWDGLVALGIVIRGETPHFDYVCHEASAGVARVSRKHRLPIGFGVLTTDDEEQAAARCGGPKGNKGAEAALAALEMVGLLATLGGAS
ncbi:MAG TPA: 6,7-dimethyl-8-ribityllumazine synthase [Thermoanaerobaculia bacterium]|nr:6,7-dimethyl-8-ribityllumazine synthase [Thermoanaerobaculia bacterium]